MTTADAPPPSRPPRPRRAGILQGLRGRMPITPGPRVEPCASWRVVAYVEGHEADVRWCGRTAGECPFPNTPQATDRGDGRSQLIACARAKELDHAAGIP